MARARAAIAADRFAEFRQEFYAKRQGLGTRD
jgi:queuine/archaeosine tRNA-ribosyltransferase